jgi:DNA-binding NarL/FixJ family response regulator
MKVLIVDDCILLQTRLKTALRKANANILISQAGNCKEALELFSHLTPDTIILDISLPDGSGIDLLRTMKNEMPHLPIFMFTNYGKSEFEKSCLELGADGFFEKSNIHGLMETIGLQYKISTKVLTD